MTSRYEELLGALYEGVPPPWLDPSQIRRFRIDSDRRRLEIALRLKEAYPLTSYYAHAVVGERYLDGVARRFLAAIQARGSVVDAVFTALERWIAEEGPPLALPLRAYEGLLHPPIDPCAEPWAAALRERLALPDGFGIQRFAIDILPFARWLAYLARHSAPDAMARAADADLREHVLVAYSSEGEIFVRDVTATVRELESAGG